jgi:hypothetical protein
MNRQAMKDLAFAVIVLWGLMLAPSRGAALTVKYEFTSVSPNVAPGGATAVCGFSDFYNGTPVITFTDPQGGGNPVTLQVETRCGTGSVPVTVNGTAAGNINTTNSACCGFSLTPGSLVITSAYNSASTAKTVSLGNASNDLVTLTGLNNTTDPMFRITVTLLPGVSTPSAGGFTNSLAPTLSWASLAAATYQVQLSVDPFFSPASVMDTTTGTNSIVVAPALTNGVSYYARVRALSGIDNGAWSYITDFTVAQTAPTTPVLVSPPNPSNVSAQTPTFNWNPVTLGTE